MALNQWFKFYGGEYLSDPKIASLNPLERSCWVTLLSLASISSDPGKVEFLTVDALMQKAGIVWDPYEPDEWEKTSGVLNRFERMRMIRLGEDGVIEVLNWTKRQDTYLTNAERQARFRDKNKKVTEHVTEVTLDKIREDKNNTGASRVDLVVSTSEEDGPTKRTSTAKYPHALEVFSWFPNRQKSWEAGRNVQEREYAEYLYERGEENVKKALAYVHSQKDNPDFRYVVVKPSDLEKKWLDIATYAKRNS